MFRTILSTLLLCIGVLGAPEKGLFDIAGFEGPQGRFFFNYPWFPLPGITLRPSGAAGGGVCSATAVATAPCTCGTATCTTGQACNTATSTCSTPAACVLPATATALMVAKPVAPCMCGTALCPITSYCSSTMVCTPVANTCAATITAAMIPCTCGTTTVCLGAAVACALTTGICT